MEIVTSIRCGNFDVDSTFKIDEILMSSLRGINVTLYLLVPLYYFLTFSALGTYSKLFWYSAESM